MYAPTSIYSLAKHVSSELLLPSPSLHQQLLLEAYPPTEQITQERESILPELASITELIYSIAKWASALTTSPEGAAHTEQGTKMLNGC